MKTDDEFLRAYGMSEPTFRDLHPQMYAYTYSSHDVARVFDVPVWLIDPRWHRCPFPKITVLAWTPRGTVVSVKRLIGRLVDRLMRRLDDALWKVMG